MTRQSLTRRYKIRSTAITLVITIDENNHHKSFINETLGSEPYTESLWFVWNEDERLNHSIAIGSAMLLEGNTSISPLNATGELLEPWHDVRG